MNRDAGQLDRRIKLLRREQVRDGEFGSVSELFTPLAEVWAKAVPAKGDERQLDGDQAAIVMERVAYRIRWRDDLERTQRIEDQRGRRFVVTSIREIDRGSWVIIEGVERGAE